MKISFNKIASTRNYVTESLFIEIDSGAKTKSFYSSKDYRPTNDFINSLNSNKDFKEMANVEFQYDGICHWQFFVSYIWPYIFFIIECSNILDKIFKAYDLKKIEYFHDNSMYSSLFFEILKAFARKHSCVINVIIQSKPISPSISVVKNILRIIYDLFINCFFSIILRFQRKLKNTNKDKVLLLSHKTNLELKKNKLHDRQVGIIYESLFQKYDPILAYTDTQNLNNLIEIFSKNKDVENIMHFGSVAMMLVSYFYRLKFLKKPNSLKRPFLINYKEIDLFNPLYIVLAHAKKNIFWQTIYFRKASKKLLEKLKPKAIFLTYETGPVQRSFLIEASRLKILTIGLQHGMIFSNHYDYAHSIVTKNFGDWGFQIPSFFFVFGEYWKGILKKFNNYDEDNIITVGKWSYQSKEDSISNTENCEKKRKVLLLTNCIESKSFIKKCKDALQHFENTEFLHRPHPSEKNSIAELSEFNIPVIDGDIYENIRQVDFAISPVSTAILDCIYSGKPVICFNQAKEEGWEEFKNIKGCFYCETEKDLKQIFTMLMDLEETKFRDLSLEIKKSSVAFYDCNGENSVKKILTFLEKNL